MVPDIPDFRIFAQHKRQTIPMAEREPETHWVESLGFLKDGKGFLGKKTRTLLLMEEIQGFLWHMVYLPTFGLFLW